MTIRTSVRNPSPSYHLALPSDIREERDNRVSSFWLDGQPLLLQLSSYVRKHGEQLHAFERLSQRMKKSDNQWRIWETSVHSDPRVDQATAEVTEGDGLLWVHSYIVWPHLTIYATISGPQDLVRDNTNWAFQALRTVGLTTN